MEQEKIREHLKDGFDALAPKVMLMTETIADAYKLGFATCYKIFTGEEFENEETTTISTSFHDNGGVQ